MNYKAQFVELLTEDPDSIVLTPELINMLNLTDKEASIKQLEYPDHNAFPYIVRTTPKDNTAIGVVSMESHKTHWHIRDTIDVERGVIQLTRPSIKYKKIAVNTDINFDASIISTADLDETNQYRGRIWIFENNYAIISNWTPLVKTNLTKNILLEIFKLFNVKEENVVINEPGISIDVETNTPFNVCFTQKSIKSTPEQQAILDRKKAEHLQAGMKRLVNPSKAGAGSMKQAQYAQQMNQITPAAAYQSIFTSEKVVRLK